MRCGWIRGVVRHAEGGAQRVSSLGGMSDDV